MRPAQGSRSGTAGGVGAVGAVRSRRVAGWVRHGDGRSRPPETEVVGQPRPDGRDQRRDDVGCAALREGRDKRPDGQISCGHGEGGQPGGRAGSDADRRPRACTTRRRCPRPRAANAERACRSSIDRPSYRGSAHCIGGRSMGKPTPPSGDRTGPMLDSHSAPVMRRAGQGAAPPGFTRGVCSKQYGLLWLLQHSDGQLLSFKRQDGCLFKYTRSGFPRGDL